MAGRGLPLTALLVCLLAAGGRRSLAGAHVVLPRSAGDPPPATSPNLEAIFVGRCHEHVQCLRGGPCPPPTLKGTCEGLWQKFQDAFAYKDPCQAGYHDYDDMVAMAAPQVEENKTLFWSGEYKLASDADRVTGKYSILESSLLGTLANQLTWCGQLTAPGINYISSCPKSSPLTCPNNTLYTFWKAASRAFARQAKGIIQVALNGSRTDAFRNSSTFATNELPNLNRSAVSHVNILLIYDIDIPGDNKRSRCDEDSVLDLQNILEARNFSYTCVEDPEDFRLLQCASDPQNPRCSLTPSSAGVPAPSVTMAAVLLPLLALRLAT